MKGRKRLSLIVVFLFTGLGFLNTPSALAGNFNFSDIFPGAPLSGAGANIFSAFTGSKNFGLIEDFINNDNVNIPRLEPSPPRIFPPKPSLTPVPVPRPEPIEKSSIDSAKPANGAPALSPPKPEEPNSPVIVKETVIKEIISSPNANTLALINSLESKFNQAISSLESKIQNFQNAAPTILQLPSTNTRGTNNSAAVSSNSVRSETLTLTNDGTIDGSLTVKKTITIGTSTIFIDGDNNKLGIGDSSPETNFEVVGTASISGAATLGGTLTLTGHTSLTTASISGNFQTGGRFIFGDNGDTGEINTSDWDISSTGALTGISGITTDGAYTQSGTSTNTLTGKLFGVNSEFQGTASASYLLTGNTLQVGGFASVAYSRFGTSTTGHSNYISTTNDLLISGDLEVRGTVSFGGVASISGRTALNGILYTWPSADGANARFLQTNGSGTLSWAASYSSNSFDFDEIVNSPTLDANLNIQRAGYFIGIGQAPSTVFEVQGTASASYLLTGNTLQVGGFASVAYSRFGTDTTSYSSNLDASNDLLISGSLEVNSNVFIDSDASVSGRFELTGSASRLGIVAGNFTDTALEVGGTASISSTLTLAGIITSNNTGSNSFSGSLEVSKGIRALALTAPTSSTLNIGPFTLAGLLTANSQNITGINQLSATTASISGNFQTSGRFIFGDNGDTGEINTSDWDISSTGALTGIGAITADGILTVDDRAEFQGTASASYFLTGNTLQVGGYSSAAYSRFGTSTTGHSNYISTTNDLLVSGDLEVRGTVSFGGVASISGRTALNGILYTWPSADGSANQFLKTNGSGALSWSTAGVSSNSLDFDEFVDSMTLDANLTINTPSSRKIGIGSAPSTYFEIQGTASASYLLTGNTLQVGGFASVAYNRFGTGTTSEAHYITTTDDVLVSGDLEVDGSVSFAGPASISNTLYVSTLGKTGNVGIGTTTPVAKLEILDANGIPMRLGDIAAAPSNQAAVYVGPSTSAYTPNNGDLLLIPRTSISAHVLMPIGNVGIGTTAPSQKLDVETSAATIADFNSTAANGGYITAQRSGTTKGLFGVALAIASITNATNDDTAVYANSTLYLESATNDIRSVGAATSTTGAAANLAIDSTSGRIQRSTSSSRYKTNIELMTDWHWLLDLQPIMFNSKTDPNGRKYGGLLAEDVAAKGPTNADGIPLFAGLDKEGRPDDVAYPHLVAPLILGLQDHESRIASLSFRIEELENQENNSLTQNDSAIFNLDILFNPEKSPSVISGLFSSIVKKFNEAMDIVFEKGLVKAAKIVTDLIETKKLTAEELQLKDAATGELYCVKITNGEWEKKKGECGDSQSGNDQSNPESTPAPSPEQTPAPSPEPSPLNVSPSETPGEQSAEPIVVAEPTPELTPEPTPEPAGAIPIEE